MANEFAAETPQPHQDFKGSIAQVALRSPESGDLTSVEMLTADLERPGQAVFIPDQAPNPALPGWGDEQAVAVIEFGGPSDDNPHTGPFETLVFKVNPKLIADMQNYGAAKHGAFMEELGQANYLLAARRKGTEWVQGYALIDHTTGFGLVGRRTNVDWFETDGQPGRLRPDRTNFTPYEENKTISRSQIVLASVPGGLMIGQRSEVTPTRVVTRAMPVHKAAVEASHAATKPQSRKWLGGVVRRKSL